MSRKRVSIDERLNDDNNNKFSKAISAFTSDTGKKTDNDNENLNVTEHNEIDVNDSVNKDVSVIENVNNNIDNPSNKFVIQKKTKQVELKRSTYYLMPETIKSIEKLSKESGMGKSALVQKLLEQALNLVQVK